MKTLTAHPAAGYEEQGSEVLPGIVDEADLGAIRGLIADLVLFEARAAGAGVADRIAAVAREELPHAGFIELARCDPEHSRRVVDRVIASALLPRIMTRDRTLEVATSCTGAPSPAALSFQTFFFRVDLPASFEESSKTFSLPWHQESGYYHRNVCKRSSIVLNVPIFDCARKDGCMEICPGSHKLGPLPHEEAYIHPEQRRHLRAVLPDSATRDYACAHAEARAGDLLVCHFNLFHRSGRNDSDRVRYTALVRVSNMFSETYVI